jgi:PhzF family phenazine biosynthesis protein
MDLSIYQVDAFTDHLFGGNPAAIIPLENWISDDLMQKIASENNLSETAFYVKSEDNFEIRWFTPTAEVDLCGHATLAAAHILFEEKKYARKTLIFNSKSGILKVEKSNNLYTMDFPSDKIHQVTTPVEILKGLNTTPLETFCGKEDYMIIFDSENEIENIQPDFRMLSLLENARGVIVTAPGNEVDFVSRCFYPQFGIDEDPATGSAHTTLTPYWSQKLDKIEMTALQLSPRKGVFHCKNLKDRVLISGQAVTYLKGKILL